MFVHMSASEFQPVSVEELAVPLFDQLYNFAHWLTRDRSEAEDLARETYTKALRGFSSFQPARKAIWEGAAHFR
jgi:DNA-directed RNA polymerase specialized sigma24 family protein